jgi:hypothetical protein
VRCAALFEVEIVAIERGDGVLVERLLERGLRVLALHPNQVKAARDRFRASGGKFDRFDCFVLCELARTDAHRFRLLEPDSDQTKALRALTRSREDLVAARVALANQLRAELERFWTGPVGLFAALDSPISLAFLARYPSPRTRAGLARSGWPRSCTRTATRARHPDLTRPRACVRLRQDPRLVLRRERPALGLLPRSGRERWRDRSCGRGKRGAAESSQGFTPRPSTSASIGRSDAGPRLYWAAA